MKLSEERLTAFREVIIHELRQMGWPRVDAENEADDRIERVRAAALAAKEKNDD